MSGYLEFWESLYDESLPGYEPSIPISHSAVCSAAFGALFSHSVRLLTVLKFEWDGPFKTNNNGEIGMSTRQVARWCNISSKTIVRSFWDLQAKGFIVHTGLGFRGVPTYEITEFPMPGKNKPSRKFLDWRPGHDFHVVKAKARNPTGRNGK